ncbi:membrane-associated protein, putative, partial [Bodo saltans]
SRTIFQAASYLVMLGIAMCMFHSGIKSNYSVNDDASSMSTVVLALSFVLSVTSCLKAIHVLFVSWWLQRLNQAATIAKSAPMARSPHQWRQLQSPDDPSTDVDIHSRTMNNGATKDIRCTNSSGTAIHSLPALAKLVTYICEMHQHRQATHSVFESWINFSY